MRRKDHPSFPSAITCCFFSSLKTLLMPKEPIKAPLGVNVPGSAMAGFQLTLYGRIWVTPEGSYCRERDLCIHMSTQCRTLVGGCDEETCASPEHPPFHKCRVSCENGDSVSPLASALRIE